MERGEKDYVPEASHPSIVAGADPRGNDVALSLLSTIRPRHSHPVGRSHPRSPNPLTGAFGVDEVSFGERSSCPIWDRLILVGLGAGSGIWAAAHPSFRNG